MAATSSVFVIIHNRDRILDINPAAFLAVLAIFLLALVMGRWNSRRPSLPAYQGDFLDRQLAAVNRQGRWYTGPVMNRSEFRVYQAVVAAVNSSGGRYLVLPQVALGSYLRADDDEAFHAVNCKRGDLLIASDDGWPVAVVEYQGSGHDLDGTAWRRDQIKRIALERAGVRVVEITSDMSMQDIRTVVLGVMAWA